MSAWLRIDAIKYALATASPRTILEIGPGLGAMACYLAESYDYTGIELDPLSYSILHRRLELLEAGTALRGTSESLHDCQFDMVCAFEVLEHISDDIAALLSWNSLLPPGGYLLLSVPAHARKFGLLDELVGHFRRYDRNGLHQVLTTAGFEVIKISSYGLLLGQAINFASSLIAQVRGRRRALSDATAESARFLQPSTAVDGLARWLAALPFRWLQRPFSESDYGTGFVALARKSKR